MSGAPRYIPHYTVADYQQWEGDWIISDDTVVRPDVIVIRGDVPQRYVTQPPAIVAEILSPSTADRDRNEKLRLFEEQGGKYYLILDPEHRTVECLQRDGAGRLLPTAAGDPHEFIICGDCHLKLDAGPVF